MKIKETSKTEQKKRKKIFLKNLKFILLNYNNY